MKYRAILFDNDDTLMDFQAGNRNAVNSLLDELGYFHPDRYEQYEEINLSCWAELERGVMNQAQLKTERFARFMARYGIPGDPVKAGDRFVELLGEQSILLPHAEETVRRIARERPVIIVTNGITKVQKARFAKSPLQSLASAVVISEEIGVAKPDPEMFRTALRPFGIAPQEALMVGDRLSGDILGANRAGMDACWYNPAGLPLTEGVHAEYIISDIRECAAIALQE